MSKRAEFVNIAKSQVGIKESGVNNVKYNTWYYGRTVNGASGTSQYAWCVVFECWCANQIGVLNTLVPKCNNVGTLRDWYKARGLYHTSGYTPKKGDLVIFKNASHTGIVESFSNNVVHTIEGNSGDSVARRSYTYGTSNIAGYCQVKFPSSTTKKTYSGTFPKLPARGYFKYDPKTPKKYYDISSEVSNLQKFLNWALKGQTGYKKLAVDKYYGKDTYAMVKLFEKVTGLRQDGWFGNNCLREAKAFKR